MKFAAIPVAEAEGAILAHSVRAGAERLRKGLVLERGHLEKLQAAGIESVVAARLDADDVHEDEAALTVARALIGGSAGNLRLTRPGTGRVNVMAEGSGVAVLDAVRLGEVNRVNPMITVATVPPFQQMEAGGMVATIKIISYGVPGRDIGKAVGRGRGAIAMNTPVMERASLIITEIPGGAGEKGRDAIEARLNALGVDLSQVCVVPHEIGALSDALAQARGEVVLILTGSATSDMYDVGPEALRHAGGKVKRFGMPVDPGNLLFLGRLGKRPVIGLPGCARSPALNGADWVLSRVVCGLKVSNADIAGMGVGGLLKEIPTRPMPRKGRRR
ncbi:molybdopterin-binding protein [Rhodobacteraceae bacterium D3-12]|nr:molybdopterin-binding protein [Rhodobacteraceae bacterium D3-12]